MKKNYLVTHGGITLDLAKVKAFHINTWNPRERSHILRIEFHSRYDYIFNPGKQEYEKVLINDFTDHPYADYETAEAYRNEWQEIWEDALNEDI